LKNPHQSVKAQAMIDLPYKRPIGHGRRHCKSTKCAGNIAVIKQYFFSIALKPVIILEIIPKVAEA
jgi:hypothetical protein